MIKNKRQYLITREQANKFERALADLVKNCDIAHESSLLIGAEEEALRSQLNDLRSEMREYESLQEGKHNVFTIQALGELPHAFIKARIASGLSQKELASRLGLKEQQIQRYEATDYASVSLTRLIETAQALGITILDKAQLTIEEFSVDTFFKRLNQVGLDRDFVIRRLLPPALSEELQNKPRREINGLALQSTDRIGRIFDWSFKEILGKDPLHIKPALIAGVRFKAPSRIVERKVSAYTVYAHYLSLLLNKTVQHLTQKHIPSDPYEVRDEILATYGSISLEGALRYVWNLGVPVLALDDPGNFHGACFRDDSRNVIVVKQNTKSSSRWMFDLFHEFWHAAQEPEKPTRTTIEVSSDPGGTSSSPPDDEDKIASQFAGAVLLGRDANKLVEMCMKEANNNVRNLKRVVKIIAPREKAPLDSLSNYLAFLLSFDGWNWWGTAARLQEPGLNPFIIARNILLEYINLEKLHEQELDLLRQAISPREVSVNG